jgi:hypothetical protein
MADVAQFSGNFADKNLKVFLAVRELALPA